MGTPGIILRGNGQNQTLFGTAGDDTFIGSDAVETFVTGLGDDVVLAGAGNDYVYADLGRDWLDGGDGLNDFLDFYFINNTQNAGYLAPYGVSVDLEKHEQDVGYFGVKTIYGFERLRGTINDDDLFGDRSDDTLFGAAGDDMLVGRDGNDMLYGDLGNDTLSGGTGADALVGGSGADRFFSGSGTDVLYGGDIGQTTDDGSRDTFIFNSTSYSPSSTTRDVIYGSFEGATGDKIDLSPIDANGSAAGNGKFSFIGLNSIGSNSISQVQVRATEVANQYLVRIDLDNDSSAEMQLFVLSTSALTSADFIL